MGTKDHEFQRADGCSAEASGVTGTICLQTTTSHPKFVILHILQCIGYLMMGTKDQEFQMEDGCSAEGSLGLPPFKL